MNIDIITVRIRTELLKFIKLPWKIYKGNKCWVPPMIKEMLETLDPKKEMTGSKITREMFLAFLDGKPAGRIFTGIDSNLNNKKNIKLGYFSLFECVDNAVVAKELFKAAFAWFSEKGIESIIGPVSVTGTDGDEYKGLLIDCFDRPPVIMNSYNPPYYKKLLEDCGFEKDYDVFAYYMDKDLSLKKDPTKAIEFAQKKYNFRIDTLNLKDVENEIKDIKHVLDLAVPDEWPDLVAPSLEEVREMAKKLMPYADPDFIAIARSGDEAIGFNLALPDLNQVLIHMNGRITPLSALKYLWYKRRIKSARAFVMFVVPAFRSKGVSYGIYQKTFQNSLKKGYIWGEASTIGETNTRMRSDMESFGAKHYKTYRIFKKMVE
ncbi:MAG: hypothetical protein A2Y21_02530 [Clostridiales bacterium GWC2_40_7]|nr:MAG: hypothetical protein A2Y21_02530 [Clostridiales bacterium GWC2_40_7]